MRFEAGIAEGEGAVLVGILLGTDAFVEAHALQVVQNKEAKDLSRRCSRTPDKSAAMPIATKAMKFNLEQGREG